MKKRIFAFLVLALLALSLVACGGDDEVTTAPPTTEAPVTDAPITDDVTTEAGDTTEADGTTEASGEETTGDGSFDLPMVPV